MTGRQPRGGQPAKERAARSTSGDTLNQQSMYELPLKEKQWVLQQINETQWNDEVIHGLSNEMLTDLWFQFIRVCGGSFWCSNKLRQDVMTKSPEGVVSVAKECLADLLLMNPDQKPRSVENSRA